MWEEEEEEEEEEEGIRLKGRAIESLKSLNYCSTISHRATSLTVDSPKYGTTGWRRPWPSRDTRWWWWSRQRPLKP